MIPLSLCATCYVTSSLTMSSLSLQVWCPYVTSQCNQESLLVMDVHRGHLSDKFRESLSSIKTDIAFIPSGCSCRLQPLDVCVTQVLRDFLQVFLAPTLVSSVQFTDDPYSGVSCPCLSRLSGLCWSLMGVWMV